MTDDDPFDLQRFVDAQAHGVYERALAELHAGAKRSHWMWFIFPQAAGLGSSAMSQHFAIGGPQEARAYLAHPLLGARYRACVAALAALPEQPAEAVFGGIDAMKLRSSLGLFADAAPDDAWLNAARLRW